MISKKTSWSLVIMLCATATAGYICRVNVSTAGVLLMEEFSLTQVAMGRIFSAFLLGYALFQIPSGILADRLGARKVLLIAAWLWAGITAMQALVGWGPFQLTLASSLIVFMAIRFVLGISASPAYPAAGQGVSSWIPAHHQGRANGIIIASIGIGSALTPLLVSNLMIHWGWRIALLATSLPAFAVAVIWRFLRVQEKVKSVPSVDQPVRIPVGLKNKIWSPAFVLLTISYTLQGYVGYIFVTWFYLYLVQERHFGMLSGAWMSSLPWVLSIISIPLGGYLSDRLATGFAGPGWGYRIIPIFGMAMAGLLISIGAHTASPLIAALSLAFATAFILCVEGPFWTMMIRLAGKNSGTAGGIMNMGSNIGGFISPALTPLLASWLGWETALHIAAGLAVLAALLWFGVKEYKT